MAYKNITRKNITRKNITRKNIKKYNKHTRKYKGGLTSSRLKPKRNISGSFGFKENTLSRNKKKSSHYGFSVERKSTLRCNPSSINYNECLEFERLKKIAVKKAKPTPPRTNPSSREAYQEFKKNRREARENPEKYKEEYNQKWNEALGKKALGTGNPNEQTKNYYLGK